MAKLVSVVEKFAEQGKVGPVIRLLPTTAAATLRNARNEPPSTRQFPWQPPPGKQRRSVSIWISL